MHRSRLFMSLLALLIGQIFVLTACGTAASPTSAPVSSAAPTVTAATVLELVSPAGTKTFTLDQLKALPVSTGWGGNKSSAGLITPPASFKGVALKDLVASLGIPFDNTMGLTLTGKDGYSMTYSYEQIVNGNFTTYEPVSGNEMSAHDPLTPILSYEQDGKPVDPVQDGPLRMQVVSAKNNQLVDGHWTEKWVVKIELKPVGASWRLKLHGAIMQPVERGTFQSCASAKCHGANWTDQNGQIWTGVPLWLLVGQVDDENSHNPGAFNDALSAAGYQVDVVGADGTTVTLKSTSIKRDGNILVAHLVNEAELPDKYYPLRLVGPDLQKDQMVGQIGMIVVHIPEPTATVTVLEATATPEPTVETHKTAVPAASAAPAAAGGNLKISGRVSNPLNLSESALRAMEVVTITADQPMRGKKSFTGVRLSSLLKAAGAESAGDTLVFTASDGYTSEIALSVVHSCSDCMMAFSSTPGSFFAVMPGQPGSMWVRDVVSIEIK